MILKTALMCLALNVYHEAKLLRKVSLIKVQILLSYINVNLVGTVMESQMSLISLVKPG